MYYVLTELKLVVAFVNAFRPIFLKNLVLQNMGTEMFVA